MAESTDNYDAIEAAASNGDIKEVRRLFASGLGNEVDSAGTIGNQSCVRAAESAARNGHLEVVKFLVQSVTDQDRKDECCMAAAESAAWSGELEVVKFLVQSVSDQHRKDECCMKAAESASFCGELEVVKFLVQSVSDHHRRDECCIEAAKFASIHSKWEVVQFLVQSVSDEDRKDECCMKAAESASKSGELEVVTYFIPLIADQGRKNECCMRAAESASRKGIWEVVKFLVQSISDQVLKDKCCMKAAESASASGKWEVVRFLVQSASPDKEDLLYLVTISAAESGHPDIVAEFSIEPNWLFQSNSLLNFLNNQAILNKNEILHDTMESMEAAQISQLLCLCISVGYVALALALIPKVSQVDLPDSSGSTALMLAADEGHHELIHPFVDAGASVDAEDSEGRTALSRACESGQVRVGKILMDRGADENHRDRCGRSCVQLAELSGHEQVMQLFQHSEDSTNEATNLGLSLYSFGLNLVQQAKQLHQLLSDSGFTRERSKCQQVMADFLQEIVKSLTKDDIQMTGSYSEGWANSLVQVNGRTAADSDIDWTVLASGQMFHLKGGCCAKLLDCYTATKLEVTEGHCEVDIGAGDQSCESLLGIKCP